MTCSVLSNTRADLGLAWLQLVETTRRKVYDVQHVYRVLCGLKLTDAARMCVSLNIGSSPQVICRRKSPKC